MSIEARITNRIDAQNVQVEMHTKKGAKVRSYKVPNNKVDTFIKNYEEQEKNITLFTNLSFISSALAGVALASIATKSISNKWLKRALNISGGVLATVCTTLVSTPYIENKHIQLLKAHRAQEIHLR